MAYDYLQGSQTGGILQGLQPAPQSYIPSIPGTQPQGYTPGYGQAPYADPAIQQAMQQAMGDNGYVDYPKLQRILGYTNQQMDAAIQKGTFSSLPSTPSGPAAAPDSQQESPLIIGDGLGWGETRTPAGSFVTRTPSAGGGGGGGGGASDSSGTSQQTGGGLNLGNIPGQSAGSTGSPSTLSSPSYSPNGTIGYTPPGGQLPQGGQPGVLQMQQQGPQAALDAYKNTAGYQLLNAPGAYQASPGYQYAMNEALGQVQNNASARGLLESGSVLKSMQQTASGLAQQDYGNWWNRQNQLYGDYQNRLQGLAGGNTGADMAMQQGQNLAAGTYQTGSNLGSLFGNQGSTGMGGIINTGAAQANAMMNAGQQQAQVNAANQATQLAGATLSQNRGLF